MFDVMKSFFFFFFNDTATTEIYTLSLHDALPIFHWLDEEGRLLGASPEAVVPQVPVVSGLSDDEVASMRSAPSPKALAAIALIRVLLRTGSALAAEISEIDMSRKDGPVLYTVDGVEVRLGTEEWEEQLARLEGVLTQVADQDVRAVDLRFRDQIILQRRRS